MIQFGTETINLEAKMVNPEYRKINNGLKKIRQKKLKARSKFYPLAEQAMEQDIDQMPVITQKHVEYKETLDRYQQKEAELIKLREQHPPRITLREMPENKTPTVS